MPDDVPVHVPVEHHIDALAQRAIAFLFAEGGSLTVRRLTHFLNAPTEDVLRALDAASTHLTESGLALVRTETDVALVANADTSEHVRTAYEKEQDKDVGDAGLEVLAILLYNGPSTRAQIDYIRGVNTSSTVRTLLARGLVERSGNPQDGREYIYRPTTELLAHLGITRSEELPDYARITNELAEFEARQRPFENNYEESNDTSGTAA